MKKQIFRCFAILSLFVITAAASVYAQSMSSTFVVEIPFDFIAGNKKLPAGEYVVRPIGSDVSGALLIQSADNREQAMILTHAVQAGETSAKAKLVFNRYGDSYFLSQAWTFGSYRGRELPRTHVELETAKSASKPQIVAVLSRQQMSDQKQMR